MTAGSASRVIRAPGRLVVGPTNLDLAFPHGGTEVGRTRAVVLQALGKNFRVEAEGLGEASDVLQPTHRYVFACFLRGFDDDAVELLWSGNFEAGELSQHAKFLVPGAALPGSSALGRAKVILYEPDDYIGAPSVLIYRGIPDWQDGAELMWRRRDELGLPLAIECMRSDAGKLLAVGRLADLEL